MHLALKPVVMHLMLLPLVLLLVVTAALHHHHHHHQTRHLSGSAGQHGHPAGHSTKPGRGQRSVHVYSTFKAMF